MKTLTLDIRDGVALCTFSRPAQRNALNCDMVSELSTLLEDLRQRSDVRALIFTGDEKTFVSGADITELKQRQAADALARINTALFLAIENFPLPTLAAIRGYALGGGLELALACDLRVAGESAKFGQPEVSLGIIPGAGATYRLPRIVGQGFARELILTARVVDAATALRMGLVNRVVADAEVLAATVALAQDIAKNSALALRLAKQSLNLAPELSTAGAVALESTAQAILFDDAEKHIRMQAFIDKRSMGKNP